MSRLLKLLLIAIVIVVAAYWLLIDIVIKTAIERQGSQALGARVEVATATFHLLPASLTVTGLQVADPQSPQRELLQANAIEVPLHLADLVGRKLLVDQMAIRGLHLTALAPQTGGSDKAATDGGNSASTGNGQQQLHEALQRLPELAANAAANGQTPSITGALLGQALRPWLIRIATALTPPARDPDLGGWQVLVKHIDIDGSADIGAQALHFAGSADDITPQPRLFDTVTRFELHGTGADANRFSSNGRVDFRKLADADLRLKLKDFPVRDLTLNDSTDLKLTVAKAIVDAQGQLTQTGNQVDLQLLARFNEATLKVGSATAPELQTLVPVLENTSAFDLSMKASGDVHNPQVAVSSSLDRRLADQLLHAQPLKQQLEQKWQQLKSLFTAPKQ